MNKNILITGGTGMIGTYLTDFLAQKGYKVSHLSRGQSKNEVKTYHWDIPKQKLEEEALIEADYIIHLAGANIFEKRWTSDFKREIIDSRVKSVHLLFGQLKILPQTVKAFISASGIGIYGADTGSQILTEDSRHGNDFISEVTEKWEAAADQMQKINIRTVKIRTGIVQSEKGGALEKMARPVKYGIVSPLGSGKQYVSWIHIEDLCNIYLKAVEDERMSGVYNAVAPNPVTNKEITQKLGKIFNKPLLLPKVPGFLLKMILGKEKANLVLGGNKVFPEKLLKLGFEFKYPTIESSLKSLLRLS